MRDLKNILNEIKETETIERTGNLKKEFKDEMRDLKNILNEIKETETIERTGNK